MGPRPTTSARPPCARPSRAEGGRLVRAGYTPAVAAGLLAVLLSGCGRPADPPADADVTSIEVSVNNPPPGESAVGPYTAAPADHERLLRLVRGGTVDPRPAKWQTLGGMKVVTVGGQTVSVDLYRTGNGPGAYRIGGTYYRGPPDAEVLAAIRDCATRAESGTGRH